LEEEEGGEAEVELRHCRDDGALDCEWKLLPERLGNKVLAEV
jgi:hypothetical protein